MSDWYEVTRGLIWWRKGDMASASMGERVAPDEFPPERWAEYLANGLVRPVEEPPPPERAPAHIEVVATVDRPPGQPHTEQRVVGGPEVPGPHHTRRRPSGQLAENPPPRPGRGA